MEGTGNFYDYGMRGYDPRIGRFPSVDPIAKQYPYLTPYQYASNRPIDGTDLDGKEWELGTVNNNLKAIPQIRNDDILRRAGTIRTWDGQPNFWGKAKEAIGQLQYSNPQAAAGLSMLYGVVDDAHVTYTNITRGRGYATHLDNSSVSSYKELITSGVNTTTLLFGGIQALGEYGLIKGLSLVERQILRQSSDVLNSKEFDVIRNAYKNGVEAEVNIKGTPVIYKPDYTYSEAMSLQQEGGFVLGPKAFVAKGGVEQTVLWEVSRLKLQNGNILEFGQTRAPTNEAQQTSEKLLPYLDIKK